MCRPVTPHLLCHPISAQAVADHDIAGNEAKPLQFWMLSKDTISDPGQGKSDIDYVYNTIWKVQILVSCL